MTDEHVPSGAGRGDSLSRREFATLTVAAGVAALANPALGHAAPSVRESSLDITTADGTCDAALARPEQPGAVPGVILFPDALGLRPTIRAMAARLAAEGYAVLVPNPFYRLARAPGVRDGFDFGNPADRARLTELRAPLTHAAVARDTAAFIDTLDRLPSSRAHAPVGVVGYCMGGLMAMQAAAGAPARIAAAASFHGGGLATDKPDSAHRLVPQMKARFYFGVAESDDRADPHAKELLTEAFRAARLEARIEVYEGTQHGWCVPDIPGRDGAPVYNAVQAERAYRELVNLLRLTLA